VGLGGEPVPATMGTGPEFGGHLHASGLVDDCEDELRPVGFWHILQHAVDRSVACFRFAYLGGFHVPAPCISGLLHVFRFLLYTIFAIYSI